MARETNAVGCPRCGALIGENCRKVSTTLGPRLELRRRGEESMTNHPARRKLWERTLELRDGVARGRVTLFGRPRDTHPWPLV